VRTSTGVRANIGVSTNTATAEPSQVLFESPLVQVGQFRCPTSHPRFADSGPTKAYCFVFPRTAVWIEHEGSRPFVADSTVVPLYNQGRPYRRRQISTDGDRTDWFSVAPAVLREMLAQRDARAADAAHRLFTFDFARASADTFLAQRRIFRHARSTDGPDRLYVEEAVISVLDTVLGSIYGRPAALHTGRRHHDLAEDVRAQLARTFARRDSLATVARVVGSSVFHLCRVFRSHTGWTLHGYRNQLRLRRSLDMLGDLDVLTTAIELGYSSHSHFTSAFHRTFGVTPSAFKGWPTIVTAGPKSRDTEDLIGPRSIRT
jgi:AraC family transcriptional regulator